MNKKIYKKMLCLCAMLISAAIGCSAPRTPILNCFNVETTKTGDNALAIEQLKDLIDQSKTDLITFLQQETNRLAINRADELRKEIAQLDQELAILQQNHPLSNLSEGKLKELQFIELNSAPTNKEDRDYIEILKKYAINQHAITSKKLKAQLSLSEMPSNTCDILLSQDAKISNLLQLEEKFWKLKYAQLVPVEKYEKDKSTLAMSRNDHPAWLEWETLKEHKGQLIKEFDLRTKKGANSKEFKGRYFLCPIALERNKIRNRLALMEKEYWEKKYNETKSNSAR